MFRFMRFLVVVAVGAFLAACGGGSNGSSATPTTPQETKAEGIWKFGPMSVTAGKGNFVDMILLDTGETWFASYDSTTNHLVDVAHGHSQSSNGTLSGSVERFSAMPGQLGPYPYSYSGNYLAKGDFNAIEGGEGYYKAWSMLNVTNKDVGRYWSDYDQSASLASLAGSYDGSKGWGSNSGDSTVIILPSGEIGFPSVEGCEGNGTLTPRASGKNIFNITMVQTGENCSTYLNEVVGIAYYDNSTRRLMVLTLSRSGYEGQGLVYLGVKRPGN